MSVMTDNPYAVLGVSENASPDEVKKAYRKKARENHPDLNPGDPAAAERLNKINEAYDRIMNPEKYAARDRRASAAGGYGGAGGARGYGQGGPRLRRRGHRRRHGCGQPRPRRADGLRHGRPLRLDGRLRLRLDDLFGFGGAGGASNEPIHPEASAGDSAQVREAIAAINAGDCQRAVNILSAVVSTGRDARWHYLAAIANQGAGNTLMALELIRKAVQMDPGNPDYQRAQRQFQQAGTAYRQEGEARGFSVGFIDPGTICCGLCFAQMICRMFMPYF